MLDLWSRDLKNKSEILFEQYLASHGISNPQFEPEVPGKTKRPDYLVSLEGMKGRCRAVRFPPRWGVAPLRAAITALGFPVP